MRRARAIASAAALTLILVSAAQSHAGCWQGIDPVYYARTCPVIVTGEIVSIDVAKIPAMKAPQNRRERRVYDVAHIRVSKVHKVDLSDVKVEVGGEVLARMNSRQENMTVSTDLSYPVGTKRIWLIHLAADGEFYINHRPEQDQSQENELALERAGAFEPGKMQVLRAELPVRSTKAQWAAEQQRQDEAEETARKAYSEQSKAAEELLAGAFRDGRQDQAGFAAVLRADKEQRLRLLHILDYRSQPPLEDWAALANFLMESDPDLDVRQRAMLFLHNKAKRPGVKRAFYEKGLTSADPEARSRACFVLGSKENKDLAPKVRALLKDGDARVRGAAVQALGNAGDDPSVDEIVSLLADEQVRVVAIKALGQFKTDRARDALAGMLDADDSFVAMRAVDALGQMGDPGVLSALVFAYKRLSPQDFDAASFGHTFAALGEMKLSLEAAAVALQSKHGESRLRGLQVLARHNSPAVVPLLMPHLVPDFRAAMSRNDHGAASRLKLEIEQLEKRPGQKFGEDLAQWVRWWDTAHAEYQAPKLPISAAEAAALTKEMQSIRAARF